MAEPWLTESWFSFCNSRKGLESMHLSECVFVLFVTRWISVWNIWRHFLLHHWSAGCFASSDWRRGKLINSLWNRGQPSGGREQPAPMSMVQRSRNSALGESHGYLFSHLPHSVSPRPLYSSVWQVPCPSPTTVQHHVKWFCGQTLLKPQIIWFKICQKYSWNPQATHLSNRETFCEEAINIFENATHWASL